MFQRHRRLRKNQSIRNMVREININLDNLIYPLFIKEGKNIKEEIPSMPGQFRFSVDMLENEINELHELGIKNILLFGIPEKKDETGSEAYNPDGIIQRTIKKIKSLHEDTVVISDICMCEYTFHGHCGILNDKSIDNDRTLEYLAKIALTHAESGVDIVAPSDMMDGRVGYIREILDKNQFTDVSIMSYSVKYSSSYYGPFRDAACSKPQFGDRKSYQMDYTRKKEAVSKVLSDIKEGADIVMVKPALAYLDIVSAVSKEVNVPVAVYNVSGEYSMVKSAANNGWIDEKSIVMENITAMRRAGADIIITYHAKDIATWKKEGLI